MQLKILQSVLSGFEDHIRVEKHLPHEHLWEITANWRARWDIDAPDFCAMFDQCLYSNLSRKLWKSDRGDAKAMLLDLMRLDPEFARRQFRELLNEDISLSKRISHFQFGCDILMEEYKRQYRQSNLTDHLHSDMFYPMLYLFFARPELHCPYFHDSFMAFMQRIKAHPSYGAADPERFVKVIRTVNHYITRNGQIQEKYEAWGTKRYTSLPRTPFIATDFYRWVAGLG